MNEKSLKDFITNIERYLGEHRLRDAFNLLKNATENAMYFELSDSVKQIERTYAYMLKYLTAGAEDPQREKVLTDIIANIHHITDLFVLKEREKDAPTLYYNTRRYNRRNPSASDISDLIQKWKELNSRSKSLANLFADASQKQTDTPSLLESVEVSIFNALWTSFPLKTLQKEKIVELICSDGSPLVSSLRFTSALGLALLEFPDPSVFDALCAIYSEYAEKEDSRSRTLSSAALVFLVVALYKYSSRILPQNIVVRIQALNDIKTWNRDVRLTFMELIRSRDTERITKTMTEEIIPGVMSLRPEIEKKIRDFTAGDLGNMDINDNPEWEELFINTDLGDKLKELSELQMEGSDVFMSTFSHLKNFPFFNEAINWFTPITEDSPYVERLVNEKPEMSHIVRLISDMPFLCDSDKFSMLFSLGMIPESQFQGMLNQIMAQRDQMEDMRSQMRALTSSDDRKNDVRNFIHNFYRFLNLFRRKGEFYNIFTQNLNLIDVTLLRNALLDADLLQLIGEFYFRHKYFKESLTAFKALEELGEFDSMLYQKTGYAYQKLGLPEKALKYYEQADLLDGNSRWLKIRMATLYRNLERFPQAFETLKSLQNQFPDDLEILMMQGYTFLAADNYREALKCFYKAEFLAPEDKKTQRAIAWITFMLRDFDRSQTYYDRILTEGPGPQDYLNMGHLALAKSQFKEAINFYKTFILENKNQGETINAADKEMFFKALQADMQHLERVGIPKQITALIVDAMFYDLEK